jgi:nucleotide-binding universal stress UspA family protein
LSVILVPTDFSVFAGYAARTAAELSVRLEAKVILLHVRERSITLKSGQPGWDQPISVDGVRERERAQMKAILSESYWASEPEVIFSEENNIVNATLHTVKQKGVDLVVIGARGMRRGLSLIVGSNTERIVHKATVPVLTVHEQPTGFEGARAVFASDFHTESDVAFTALQPILKGLSAKLSLLHVVTPSRFETSALSYLAMEDFAKRHELGSLGDNKLEGSLIWNEMAIPQGIAQCVLKHNFDIVCMATHSSGLTRQLVQGSVAEQVINLTQKAVLTYRLGS